MTNDMSYKYGLNGVCGTAWHGMADLASHVGGALPARFWIREMVFHTGGRQASGTSGRRRGMGCHRGCHGAAPEDLRTIFRWINDKSLAFRANGKHDDHQSIMIHYDRYHRSTLRVSTLHDTHEGRRGHLKALGTPLHTILQHRIGELHLHHSMIELLMLLHRLLGRTVCRVGTVGRGKGKGKGKG